MHDVGGIQMKFSLSLKNKEAKLEADVERLIEKKMDNDAKNPARKTRYQIKQEEKRKNEELKHKQQMTYMFMLLGIAVFCLIFGMIAHYLGI